MITYGVFNPSSFIAPSPPITIYGVDHTIKYIRVLNNSPYQLAINLGSGQIIQLAEFWQKDIPVPSYSQGNLIITPSIAIQTSSHAQAYQLTVQGLVDADNGGGLDSAIPQQAVTATASGSPIYSTFFGVSSSAGNNQSLNIFNPANSGVIMVFHLAQAFTNSAGIPTANLIYLAGADLNFGGAANAKSHTGTAIPPTSVAHITTDDSSSGFGGSAIRVSRLTGSSAMATSELLPFPDNFTLYPGGNLRLSVADTTTGHVVEINLGWTELVVVPPIFVTGATGVASQIDSELFAVGTNLIKSVVPGPLTPVQLFNDGTGFYSVDQSGTLHRVFTFNSAGNPLQVGQAGDILEALGQLLVDQLATLTGGAALNILNDLNGRGVLSISDSGPGTQNSRLQADTIVRIQVPAGTDIATFIASNMTLNQEMVLNAPAIGGIINGSVGGTIAGYCPIWGNALKVFICIFTNYNSASVASFSFPTNPSRGLAFTGNMGAMTASFFLSGVAQNVNAITALGTLAANGTFSANGTTIHAGSFIHFFTPADSIQFGSTGGAVNGVFLFVGI